MSVKWTEEQEKVIQLRNRSLLVSAAAGSGKTAVLVQRIISMVMDEVHPLDIDRLLVVTFTNAAAAEMRERVGTAIEAALEKDPYNQHLQRQLTLVHNAQITTIVNREADRNAALYPDFAGSFSQDRSGTGISYRRRRRTEIAAGRCLRGGSGGVL